MQTVPDDLLVGLRRARDRIDRHYAEPLDLDALAATAGLSKYHFLRCFARTYGRTPHAYLTERRVERAQDLLRATNLTVTEVCWLVGYSGLGSFSTRFRRLVGCSPSEYQARWARTGPPRIPGCFVMMHGLSDRSAERSRSIGSDRAIAEKPEEDHPRGESSA
ncbi:AraC family transcriptional regulator [Actinomycetospora succinea]|uniref:AraC family transcriptional regulator n=1 Tax=Actinomycetospora succinea TaxID=663603 RepID=A0A4V3D8H5_9PSEU|nr:AraC family transcriptional regulator [Actinomycetospora succinea]TDQ51787.1 AraC family transcriptional regulator [Actinomycetospora succinea]